MSTGSEGRQLWVPDRELLTVNSTEPGKGLEPDFFLKNSRKTGLNPMILIKAVIRLKLIQCASLTEEAFYKLNKTQHE